MRWLSLLHTRPDKDRRRNERGHQGPLRVAADDSLVGLTLRELAARVAFLDAQSNSTVVRLKRITEQFAPSLVAMYGVGPDTASTLLLTAGDNPDRLRSERSFASPTGSCPVPATSGLIETRHRPRLRVGGSGMATGSRMDRPSRSPWLVCREVALVDAVVLRLEARRGCSRDSRRVLGGFAGRGVIGHLEVRCPAVGVRRGIVGPRRPTFRTGSFLNLRVRRDPAVALGKAVASGHAFVTAA